MSQYCVDLHGHFDLSKLRVGVSGRPQKEQTMACAVVVVLSNTLPSSSRSLVRAGSSLASSSSSSSFFFVVFSFPSSFCIGGAVEFSSSLFTSVRVCLSYVFMFFHGCMSSVMVGGSSEGKMSCDGLNGYCESKKVHIECNIINCDLYFKKSILDYILY